MLKKIFLPVGIFTIAQMNQGYTMDDAPASQKAQTTEEKESFDRWAAGEGRASFDPTPGGTGQLPKDVINKISEFGQKIRYKNFTCPAAEEVKEILNKSNFVPGALTTSVDFKGDILEISKRNIIAENLDKMKLRSLSFTYNNSDNSFQFIQCNYSSNNYDSINIELVKENNAHLDKLENQLSLNQNRQPFIQNDDYTVYDIKSPETENIIFKFSLKESK